MRQHTMEDKILCCECGENEAKFPNEVCDECLEIYDAVDDDEYYQRKEEEGENGDDFI